MSGVQIPPPRPPLFPRIRAIGRHCAQVVRRPPPTRDTLPSPGKCNEMQGSAGIPGSGPGMGETRSSRQSWRAPTDSAGEATRAGHSRGRTMRTARHRWRWALALLTPDVVAVGLPRAGRETPSADKIPGGGLLSPPDRGAQGRAYAGYPDRLQVNRNSVAATRSAASPAFRRSEPHLPRGTGLRRSPAGPV